MAATINNINATINNTNVQGNTQQGGGTMCNVNNMTPEERAQAAINAVMGSMNQQFSNIINGVNDGVNRTTEQQVEHADSTISGIINTARDILVHAKDLTVTGTVLTGMMRIFSNADQYKNMQEMTRVFKDYLTGEINGLYASMRAAADTGFLEYQIFQLKAFRGDGTGHSFMGCIAIAVYKVLNKTWRKVRGAFGIEFKGQFYGAVKTGIGLMMKAIRWVGGIAISVTTAVAYGVYKVVKFVFHGLITVCKKFWNWVVVKTMSMRQAEEFDDIEDDVDTAEDFQQFMDAMPAC